MSTGLLIPTQSPSVDLEHLLRQRESLRGVIESISSELALEPLLTRIVESAVRLLGALDGTIGLLVEGSNGPVIRTAAVYNMPPQELGAEMAPGIGLAGRVLQSGEPLVLDRYGDLDHPTLPELADHAVIGLPIYWGERMIGFFGLGATPPRRFDATDLDTLTLFARHAAIAIRNAQLYEAEKRRVARIAVINRIARLVASSLSLDQLLQTAVQAFDEQLHYSNVALLLLDADDPEMLILRAGSGIYAQPGMQKYRQSIRRGIIGAVAQSRRRVLINNVWADPRYVPIPGVRSIVAELAIPLAIGDRLLGVLNLESEDPISDEDAAGFEIIGDQLAIAIDNARLFERERERTERLELLARISQRIAGRLERLELFSTTTEELHQRLGYDHVSLFLVDAHDSTWLEQAARASRWPRGEAPSYRQPVGSGIVGSAAQKRVPVLVNDVRSDRRYIPVPRADAIRAELAIPIISGERLLGVLDVASARRFREEDVQGLGIVADQLAIALDNAQLFERTQLVLEETRLLYETSQRISYARDVDEVVVAYLEQVAARGRYTCHVAVYEFNSAGERIASVLLGRWLPEEGVTLMAERRIITERYEDRPLYRGQTTAMANVHTDPQATEALRERQRQSGRPAVAMIPLMVRGQCIGLVVLSHGVAEPWQPADLQPYEATAAQLATAIDSRRQNELVYERGQQLAVFQERQRLARELHDSVTQLIFSMTLIAQSISSAWRRDPAEGEKRTNRLLELSQAALAEMRALLAELRPPDTAQGQTAPPMPAIPSLERVRKHGLAQALLKYGRDIARDGLHVELDDRSYVRRPLDQEETIFRIAQEALNNVVKHAQARRVLIQMVTEPHRTRVAVIDDGVGLARARAAAATGRTGLGLSTMRERVEEVGGVLNVLATPGGGTTIEIVMPN